MIYQEIRPQSIEKLYGSSLQPIRDAIKNNKIPTALLLHGERGVGKTSTAYVLAKYLPQCKVVEINAASDSTKKDAEKIIASANSLAIGTKSKIILIEEVHKASAGFQNALLRPLENPAPGIHWVLCTTEVNKVITTIQSRCQKVMLKPLTKADTIQVLKDGRKACSVTTELPISVLNKIFDKVGGHARDALTELQTVTDLDDEAEMLSRLEVIKEEDNPKISDVYFSLYSWKGRKDSIQKLNRIRKESPEGVRRVILKIADTELLKCPETEDGDLDAEVIHGIIRCFNSKEVFTDYMDLVEACLNTVQNNRRLERKEKNDN